MTAAFTPGPWKISPTALGFYRIIDVADSTIADTGFWGDSYKEEQHANASLIAAAPDLYNALDLFVAEYVELVESGDAGSWDAEKESKVILARSALAKARGAA